MYINRLTKPRQARLRIAGLVIPFMYKLKNFKRQMVEEATEKRETGLDPNLGFTLDQTKQQQKICNSIDQAIVFSSIEP